MHRLFVILLAASLGAAALGCKKTTPKASDGQPSASAEDKAGKDLQKRLDEALKK